MSRLGLHWLAAVCLTSLLTTGFAGAEEPSKLTEEQRQALTAEAKRLWEEAQRLDKEGKLKEAIAAGERSVIEATTRRVAIFASRSCCGEDFARFSDWRMTYRTHGDSV